MRSFLSIFFFLICLNASSQHTISGIIKDKESGNPLSQATVTLVRLPDSVFVKGCVTSPDGGFSATVMAEGDYAVKAAFLGYSLHKQKVTVSKSQKNYDLGPVLMVEQAHLLKGAVVEAQVPPVTVKEDTIEYNVDSYKMQPNAVVEDLLKKLPGVDLDSEGKITANGKEVKKVYVDGKEFFGSDPTVATKNLNTDIIDKIQVIDKKSDLTLLTGVDDGDDETVLNLTIKKGMKHGWFGNITAGYGDSENHHNRYEVSAMVNRFEKENQYSLLGGINNINNQTFTDKGGGIFSGSSMRGGRNSGGAGSGISTAGSAGANFNVGRDNDFRVGGNLFFSGKDQDESKDTYRENFWSDSSTYYNSSTQAYNNSRNFSGDFKLEWQMDSLTRLQLQPSFGYNHTSTDEWGEFLTTDEKVEMNNWSDWQGDYVNRGSNSKSMDMQGGNYSMRATIARESARKQGRKISLSLTYSGSQTDGTSYTDNKVDYDESGAYAKDTIILTKQRQTEDSDVNGARAYLTWVEPFADRRFLQLSYNVNYSFSKSYRNTFLWNGEGYNQLRTDSLSDILENTSLTQSVGLSVRTVRDKYNYSIGVNLDPSMQKSKDMLDDSRTYTQNVINVAPALEYNYLWSKRTSLRIQYRGRTTQPSISQLQPSKNVTDPLYIRQGNMDLKPSYANTLSARFNKFNPEKMMAIMGMVEGGFTLNSITDKTTYDRQTGVQTTMPVNVNGAANASARLMVNIPVASHWQINSSSNASYRRQVGYVSLTSGEDSQKNISQNYSVRENFAVNYRSDFFDLGVRGNYQWTRADNSVSKSGSQSTQNYGATFSASLYFPWSIVLASDYTCSSMTGYAAAFGSSENLWNAKLTKSFASNRGSLYVRVNDILQEKKTISRTIGTSSIQDVRTDQLTSYVMVGFSFRFSNMGNQKMHQRDSRMRDMPRSERGDMPGPPPGGGFGGPPPGM